MSNGGVFLDIPNVLIDFFYMNTCNLFHELRVILFYILFCTIRWKRKRCFSRFSALGWTVSRILAILNVDKWRVSKIAAQTVTFSRNVQSRRV